MGSTSRRVVILEIDGAVDDPVFQDESMFRLHMYLIYSVGSDGALVTTNRELAGELNWASSKLFRTLAKLTDLGVIQVEQVKQKSKHKKTRISVVNHGDMFAERSGSRTIKWNKKSDPKTKIERRVKRGYSREFATWYEFYPRKQQPANAEKAYAKAVKHVMELRSCSEADAIVTLLAKVKAYAEIFRHADVSKLPYPASWLNAHQYRESSQLWVQLAKEMGFTAPQVTVEPMKPATKKPLRKSRIEV